VQTPAGSRAADARPRSEAARPKGAATKLSYKETRELAALPGQIEALEREQREINERMASPDYHRQGTAQIRADGLRLAAIETELASCFDRWAELEARSAAPKTSGPV
jgi:ATP-binding cassette subfamily F protein uup